jgi:hypothetical protein
MWDFLKNLKSFLSLDYRSLFIVSCVSWVIVIIPIKIWQDLGLLDVWYKFRSLIFLIGLLSTSWLLFGFLYDRAKIIMDNVKKRIAKAKEEKSHKRMIDGLSRVEKAVLARYISDDTTTLAFDIRDGVINGLIKQNILYSASNASNPFTACDFDVNIQKWVWDLLKANPDILKNIEPLKSGRHQINIARRNEN